MKARGASFWALLLAALALIAGLAFLLLGGQEGAELSAAEFVERVNEQGAGIEVGEQLSVSERGSVYDLVLLDPPAAERARGASAAQTDGTASLIVAPDEDGGVSEYDRCESAASLICFRAANAVVLVEDATPEQLARLGTAIQALGSQ